MGGLILRLAVAVALLVGGAVATNPVVEFDLARSPEAHLAVSVIERSRDLPDELVDDRATPAVQQQLIYAVTYWNDYNTDLYGDFNEWGGDCQNFVSQTLVARGWKPNDEWFNDAQEDWAPAFVAVPSFDDYLREHPELGAVALTLDQRDQVKLGDVVVYDWDRDGSLDHIEVVTRIVHHDDGRITIATIGHSDINSWYRDLDHAITVEHPGALAYFWSIPEPLVGGAPEARA